ncbi:hypothetical protein Clacol_005711 [Clathrus columnatus]|uniref:Fork-head domain-containing protein n=1 Tax=Clathrus columnatus TaxID=1419009 RepID=A0AAV5ADB8_9AGAM|nr:hypothetical protein Clacol_005711 [Clathrus columnatus]
MSDVPDVSESTVTASEQSGQRRLPKKVVALAVGSHLSILAAQSPFANYPESSLPFPLNLPPSYPVYCDSTLARPQRQALSGASLTSSRGIKDEGHASPTISSTESAACPPGVSSSTKGKRSLDAFMRSRQTTQSQTESSGSDSDTSLRKACRLCFKSGESSRILSSSPPSSSPVQTPRGSSPVHPTLPGTLIGFSLSPSPRPKRKVTNARAGPSSSASTSTSDLPYTLPPGPYPEERPVWSLAALIGQAINASFASALPLNDIYTYISTAYPYFDRRDQAWMSSIRHSLSVNEAFERVYDQDGTAAKKVKFKGKTRLKGGFWRIRPGYEDCFIGGNFVRKGAKGPGPGGNSGSRKRAREEDDSRGHQKTRTTGRGMSHHRSNSNIEMAVTERKNTRMRSQSSPEPAPSKFSPLRSSPPSSPSASQSTYPSDSLSLGTSDNTTPELSNAQRKLFKESYCEPMNILAKLEAGFELQSSSEMPHSDKPAKNITPQDILSNQPFHPSPFLFPSSTLLSSCPTTPIRYNTPPPRAITPSRTPISYKGLQMSPTRSLAHYKNSLEPEWKVAVQPSTPPAGGSNPAPFSTPQRYFPNPIRTSSKHYDPYDPETLLADELASMRQSRRPQESPGGIFGKEGRKLLYESPSVPGKSAWRFSQDEL